MMNRGFSEYSRLAQAGIVVGSALLVVGVFGLAGDYAQVDWWHALVDVIGASTNYLLPLSLVGLGVYLLWAAKHDKLNGLRAEHEGTLARSVTDRRFAGVCGGIAQYLDIDSVVVRIVVLLLFLASPLLALIAYVLLALILPRA